MGKAKIKNAKMLIANLIGSSVFIYEDMLEYIYNAEEQSVLNNINQTILPHQLEHIVEERAVGRYLQMNKKTILSDEELQAPKSIREGDITVDFGNVSVEGRLDKVIAHLLKRRDSELACYRTLKW